MSTSIRMNSFTLTPPDTQNISAVHSAKNIGFHLSGTGAQNQNNMVDTILNISKEARLKLKNRQDNADAFKEAGVTSVRDQWEDEALDTRDHMRRWHREEWMRLDEPETYAKCRALQYKFAESGAMYYGDEGFEYSMECSRLENDWYCRRCFDEEGNFQGPPTGVRSVISSLETRYSDSIHDTSVDLYDNSFTEKDQSPFRFGTKFNVLMPVELLRDLELLRDGGELSDREKEEAADKQQKVDAAVNDMKEMEKNYEGSLQGLRFAVKFDKGGNATYYADYAFREEGRYRRDGISAKTAEELFEELMSK